jgi:hypothetical protein
MTFALEDYAGIMKRGADIIVDRTAVAINADCDPIKRQRLIEFYNKAIEKQAIPVYLNHVVPTPEEHAPDNTEYINVQKVVATTALVVDYVGVSPNATGIYVKVQWTTYSDCTHFEQR